jgi:hypothetical protein
VDRPTHPISLRRRMGFRRKNRQLSNSGEDKNQESTSITKSAHLLQHEAALPRQSAPTQGPPGGKCWPRRVRFFGLNEIMQK